MIGKRNKVKKAGDERLLRIVAQLQRQLAEQKVFDQTTIDYSFDNRVLNKILHAKFIFCMKKLEEETLNLVAHQALLLDNVVHCGGLFLWKNK